MMEICWFSEPVSQMDESRYGKEPGWLDHIRGRAARALADMIVRSDKVLYRRIPPTEDQLRKNPDAPIKHQFSIGLESDLDELKARERQIEQGRLAGRQEAVAICLEAAKRYRDVNGDGACKWVIASALEDAAKAIQTV